MWNSKFLNVEQVANILGISPWRVRELAAAGSIKGFKPTGARRWRFTKTAVATYMGCTEEDI